MLRLLIKRGEISVSAVAREIDRPVSATSEYLRTLNARGLLSVRRAKRFVYYRVDADQAVPDSAELLPAVVKALQSPGDAVSVVFRAVTGLTHPLRQQILNMLSRTDMVFNELRDRTGVSRAALRRHLSKLQARGFVELKQGCYRCGRPPDLLRKTLLKLASH